MKNFDAENFINDLAAQINYEMMPTINDSIRRKFEVFMNVFNNVVTSHAKTGKTKRKKDYSETLVNLRYPELKQNKKQNV